MNSQYFWTYTKQSLHTFRRFHQKTFLSNNNRYLEISIEYQTSIAVKKLFLLLLHFLLHLYSIQNADTHLPINSKLNSKTLFLLTQNNLTIHNIFVEWGESAVNVESSFFFFLLLCLRIFFSIYSVFRSNWYEVVFGVVGSSFLCWVLLMHNLHSTTFHLSWLLNERTPTTSRVMSLHLRNLEPSERGREFLSRCHIVVGIRNQYGNFISVFNSHRQILDKYCNCIEREFVGVWTRA